jgi:hypothetical protein
MVHMDPFLNIFFLVFHSAFILFVLFGWIWIKARKVHLAAVVLTAVSWFGLGIFYGFGYCFCTDWHWSVLQRMGHADLPRSYIKFLIMTVTGWDLNDALVDAATVGAFLGVFALAVYLAVAKKKKKDI